MKENARCLCIHIQKYRKEKEYYVIKISHYVLTYNTNEKNARILCKKSYFLNFLTMFLTLS